jgi:hypothetical protein
MLGKELAKGEFSGIVFVNVDELLSFVLTIKKMAQWSPVVA